VSAGFTPIVPIAKQYLGAFDLLIIITALTAATGVFVATAVGATRVVFAMGREGTLPSTFGKIHGRTQAPWNAGHLVFALSLVATVIWPIFLTNSTTGAPDPLASFIWFAGAITFFALVVYIFVNLANILFHWRFARPEFNYLTNLVVPVVGIAVDLVLMWNAFFVSLWNTTDFRMGQAVVYACVAVLALGVVYTFWLKMTKPQLLKAEALVFEEHAD